MVQFEFLTNIADVKGWHLNGNSLYLFCTKYQVLYQADAQCFRV